MEEQKKEPFRIFFSVGSREYLYLLLICGVKNILTSFIYAADVVASRKILQRNEIKLMLDSGAFTAWSQGKEVNLDKYLEFAKANIDIIDPELIVGLDIILGGTKKATQQEYNNACKRGMENYYYALKKGVKTIPVFHQGDNFIYLEEMCKKCDRIGISPNNDYDDNIKERWLQECFEIIKQLNPSIKTHAFGVTSWQLLSQFPYTSADSSAWALTSAFGTIYTPYGRVIISDEQKNRIDFIDYLPLHDREAIIKYIESYGFSYKLVKKSYKYRNILNIFHYLEMEKKLNENPVQLYDRQSRLFEPLKLHKDQYQKLQEKILQNDIF